MPEPLSAPRSSAKPLPALWALKQSLLLHLDRDDPRLGLRLYLRLYLRLGLPLVNLRVFGLRGAPDRLKYRAAYALGHAAVAPDARQLLAEFGPQGEAEQAYARQPHLYVAVALDGVEYGLNLARLRAERQEREGFVGVSAVFAREAADGLRGESGLDRRLRNVAQRFGVGRLDDAHVRVRAVEAQARHRAGRGGADFARLVRERGDDVDEYRLVVDEPEARDGGRAHG